MHDPDCSPNHGRIEPFGFRKTSDFGHHADSQQEYFQRLGACLYCLRLYAPIKVLQQMQVTNTGLSFAASYFSPFLKIVPRLSSSSRHHIGIFILIVIFSNCLPQYLTVFSQWFWLLLALLFFYFSFFLFFSSSLVVSAFYLYCYSSTFLLLFSEPG